MDQILRQCSLGEHREREDLDLRGVHQGPDLGVAGGELALDFVPLLAHRGQVGLGEDRAEQGRDHVGVGLGYQREQVANVVDPAPLMPSALEAPPDRRGQAGVLVADYQPHAPSGRGPSGW